MRKNKTNSLKMSGAVLLCGLILAVACQPQGQEGKDTGKTAADTKEKPASVDKEGKEGKEVPSGPCGEYAAKLCEVVGAKSQTCKSAESVTGLMPEAACTSGMANIEYTKTKYAEKRKTCNTLMEKLCAEVGEDTKSCEMVKTQTPNFPPERCESMMQKIDKIVEDLKAREAANKPLDPDKQKAIATGDAAAVGPVDAKVTVVEFSDFECPYCSKAANAVGEVMKKYKSKVRFVFRHFPLTFHKNAHLASQAALAADAQGKFWEYHDRLFENQKALKREDLEKYAKELGLDVAQFKKALDDETFKANVDGDMELGKSVAVRGTPTIFLNGERVANPTNVEAIIKEIETALGK